MKPIQIVERDFKTVGRIHEDFKDAQGLAQTEVRRIYIDSACAARTRWGKRVIIEHEIAHMNVADAGLDGKLTPAQDELLADWIGMCRTPKKSLQVNENHLKQWLLAGLKWRRVDDRLKILTRIVELLGICADVPAADTAARLCAAMR